MEVSDGELIYTDFDPLYGEMEVRQQVPSGERSHVPPHHYVLVTDKVNYTDEDILRNCSEWVNGTWSNNISYDCSVWMNETWSNNTFYDLDMYSTGFKIAIAIIYNCVFLLALIGNSLVCYVVFSSPRMRTTTNYLIANLALGDLLMAVLCVPFSYIPVLLQYWPFGHFLCYLLPPAQAISVLVSSYTLIVLAVDRYIAIIFPLRPRFRRSQACWVILLVWFIAIITASPIAIFTEYYTLNETGLFYCEETGWESMGVEEFKLPYGITMMILQYFFPITVLIFTYSRIAMAVWGNRSLGEAEDSRDQRLARTKRKTVVISLLVVTGYTAAWFPFNLFVLVGPERIAWYPQYVFFACHSLAMAHTTFNPVIYAWMNVRFRTAFLSVLSRLNLLCPCLLNLCLARNSNSSSFTANQYPFSHTSNHHHSVYIRQQIYGSTAHDSNKSLLQQQQQQQQLQKQKQRNQKNEKASPQSKQQRTYRLTNGSVKSTVDSDPLVLITIPAQNHVDTKTNTNNSPLNHTNKEIGRDKQLTSSQDKLNTSHKADQSGSSSNGIINISNCTVVIGGGGSNNSIKNEFSPPISTSPSVDIMTTAKDEDLMEDESEAESPVWT